jgi:hypothetical protein
MKIAFTEGFFCDFVELPKSLQTKCRKLIEELDKTTSSELVSNKLPGWRLHKLQSSPFMSLSIDMNYRLLAKPEGNGFTLHRVVKHDVADSSVVNRNDKRSAFAEFSHVQRRGENRVPNEFRGRVVEDLALGKIMLSDERRFVQLDSEQFRCIDDFLVHNARALVNGSPGTGKTLIAAEAAARLRNEGKRVLLICFTEALAHWLRSQIAGNKVEVWAIKRLAVWLLEASERPINVPVRREDWTPEFWRSVTPLALREARGAIDSLDFDAIIVDEGQDLDPDDWRLIERFTERNCRLWVFCDPSQRLWSDREITAGNFAKYHLGNQYRCHETIQALANLYQSQAEQIGAAVRRSTRLKGLTERRIAVIPCSTRDHVLHAVTQEVDRLLAEGLDLGGIAIVSLVSRTDRGAIAGLHKLNETHALVRADDERMRDELVADSVYRFKGLERSAVILTDLSLRALEDEAIRRAKMNVAITRAQSFLRIIDTEEAISREPELIGLQQ